VVSPPHVAPPWGGKRVVYRSTFAQPWIMYRDLTHGGAWTERVVQAVGPGRNVAEQTFRVVGLAPSVYWRGTLQAYDGWLRAGHAVNDDLRLDGGAGESHNEPAWTRRLPAFLV
jgi:hypothetical protein